MHRSFVQNRPGPGQSKSVSSQPRGKQFSNGIPLMGNSKTASIKGAVSSVKSARKSNKAAKDKSKENEEQIKKVQKELISASGTIRIELQERLDTLKKNQIELDELVLKTFVTLKDTKRELTQMSAEDIQSELDTWCANTKDQTGKDCTLEEKEAKRIEIMERNYNEAHPESSASTKSPTNVQRAQANSGQAQIKSVQKEVHKMTTGRVDHDALSARVAPQPMQATAVTPQDEAVITQIAELAEELKHKNPSLSVDAAVIKAEFIIKARQMHQRVQSASTEWGNVQNENETIVLPVDKFTSKSAVRPSGTPLPSGTPRLKRPPYMVPCTYETTKGQCNNPVCHYGHRNPHSKQALLQ